MPTSTPRSHPPNLLHRNRRELRRFRGNGYSRQSMGRNHRVNHTTPSFISFSLIYLSFQKLRRPTRRSHSPSLSTPTILSLQPPRNRRLRRTGDHFLPSIILRTPTYRSTRLISHLPPIRRQLPDHRRKRRTGTRV